MIMIYLYDVAYNVPYTSATQDVKHIPVFNTGI